MKIMISKNDCLLDCEANSNFIEEEFLIQLEYVKKNKNGEIILKEIQ